MPHTVIDARKRRAFLMIGLGAAIGVVLFIVAALFLRPAVPTDVVLKPDDAALVAIGRTVYEAECSRCHGANLEGQPNWREPGPDGRLPAPPHDETGHTWHHPDDVLFQLTKYGLPKQMGNGEPYFSNMPAYESVLTDEEIIAVLSYIKSRWPADIRRQQDATTAQFSGG